MIERFNFFDIYGYLFPGGLLLGLLWVPFGLLLGRWPSAGWVSAIVGLVVAYMVGHILRVLSDVTFQSKFRDGADKLRYPSDLLLDENADSVLPVRLGLLKYRVEAQVRQQFAMEMNVNAPWNEDLGRHRNIAFQKCRSYLVQNKSAAYAEQQQGIYEMFRGLSAAFIWAAVFYMALAVGSFLPDLLPRTRWLFIALVTVQVASCVLAALIGIKQETRRRLLYYSCTAIFFAAGLLSAKFFHAIAAEDIGPPRQVVADARNEKDATKYVSKSNAVFWSLRVTELRHHPWTVFLPMTLVSALCAQLSFFGFRGFAANFAFVVFRDFSTLAPPPTPNDIQRRAYSLYLQRKCDNAQQNWLDAEQQLHG